VKERHGLTGATGVRVHLKAPWRSGATHADIRADEFLARLCAPLSSPPPASSSRSASTVRVDP